MGRLLSFRIIKLCLALLIFFPIYGFSVHAAEKSLKLSQLVEIEKRSIDLHKSQSAYNEEILSNFTASTKDNKLQDSFPDKNLSTLIEAYCVSVLSAGNLFDGDLFYSARQSAFVYLLCTNINAGFAGFSIRQSDSKTPFEHHFTGYFKNSDFDKLGLPVNKNENHLAYLYVDDLFNNIINEYFNIKQANIYGLVTDKVDTMKWEDQANQFSRLHFDGIEICNSADTNKLYAKKTCKYMTQYLKSAKKMFEKLNIINTTTLFADYKDLRKANDEKKPPVTNFCSSASVLQGDYQILPCGLRGDGAPTTMVPFVNLVYNEFFYYSLFVQYFSAWLQAESNNLNANSKTDAAASTMTIASNQAKKALIMQNEFAWSRDALAMSIRVLRNAYVTYPIHIGLLMYREKLQDFGKVIAKIATPIYTLYDKFRNVQCPKK